MIKKVKKNWGLPILLGTYIIIFNPPILYINFMHFVGIVSLFSLLFKKGNRLAFRFSAKEEATRMYYAFITIFFYLAIHVVLNNASFTIITFPIYFVMDIMPLALLMKRHMSFKNLSSDDLIELFYVIALIQAIIAIVCYIIPSFHQLIVKLYLAYGYGSSYAADARYRNFGYAGGLTFSTAVFQAVISVLLFVDYKKRGFKALFYSLLILFSAFINARTSLIAFALAISVALFISKISINRKFEKIGIMLITLIFGYFIVLPLFSRNQSETFSWVVKGYKEIIGFFYDNNTTDGYFAYVTNKNRWPVPPTFLGIIFGRGHLSMGGMELYGISSDVGYINDLWLGGILYILGVYIMFYRMIIKLYKRSNVMVSTCGLILMILIPVINIKGPIFGMNDITNLITILFICTGYKKIGHEVILS